MESAEKTPWIDPIRPPGRDLTRAAARVAQEENRCGSRFFGAAPPFPAIVQGTRAARNGAFVRKETGSNEILQKFEKPIDKYAAFVYYISRRRARHKTAMRRCQPGSIAQLGEHLPYKQRVTGSSPVVPTNSIWRGSSVG